MSRFNVLALGLAAGIALFTPSTQAVEPVKAGPASSQDTAGSDGMRGLVDGNNRFAVDLYSRLRSTNSGNLFLSPYSISAALAMTFAGSAGDTRKQMAEVLHFTVPEPELHRLMAQLRQNLRADAKRGYQLRIANRLWGHTGYEFLPEFLATTREHYAADLGIVDFARNAEAGRQEINRWVETETERKITDLIPPGAIDARTRLVLANAIYFKANWQDKFNEKLTADTPFHIPGGEEVTVPMMHQTRSFGYRAADDLQILEMPYVDGKLSMLVLLPKEIEGLPALEGKLTAENLRQWTTGLRPQRVIVYLPRFEMTSQFGLNDTLQSMGMTLPFDDLRADFSRMSPAEGLYISAVVHKAFVDVNEEGTEAAAATGVIMAPRAAIVDEPPTFRADHPFLFLIRDNQTGSILFIGRVTNPKK